MKDALRLGCSAIGFTIYFGADAQYEQIEEVREAAREAKACGLAVVVWAYPRGGALSKEGETAIDVVAYGAHMAALLGAHIIKVKTPTAHLEQAAARRAYEDHDVDISTLERRIAHVVQCAFGGRRIVVFSGGSAKADDDLLAEVRSCMLTRRRSCQRVVRPSASRKRKVRKSRRRGTSRWRELLARWRDDG